MQREQRGQRLTYGAEAKTDFFEGRYFFGVDGKIHTYADDPDSPRRELARGK